MIPYVLFASIALFILLARNTERFHVLVLTSSSVGAPLVLNIIVFAIQFGGEAASETFLTPAMIITTLLQLLVAFVVFRGLKISADDNFTAYFTWAAIGWPCIFLLTPLIVGKLL